MRCNLPRGSGSATDSYLFFVIYLFFFSLVKHATHCILSRHSYCCRINSASANMLQALAVQSFSCMKRRRWRRWRSVLPFAAASIRRSQFGVEKYLLTTLCGTQCSASASIAIIFACACVRVVCNICYYASCRKLNAPFVLFYL